MNPIPFHSRAIQIAKAIGELQKEGVRCTYRTMAEKIGASQASFCLATKASNSKALQWLKEKLYVSQDFDKKNIRLRMPIEDIEFQILKEAPKQIPSEEKMHNTKTFTQILRSEKKQKARSDDPKEPQEIKKILESMEFVDGKTAKDIKIHVNNVTITISFA